MLCVRLTFNRSQSCYAPVLFICLCYQKMQAINKNLDKGFVLCYCLPAAASQRGRGDAFPLPLPAKEPSPFPQLRLHSTDYLTPASPSHDADYHPGQVTVDPTALCYLFITCTILLSTMICFVLKVSSE